SFIVILLLFFFLRLRPPLGSTLFPYTTLFRSWVRNDQLVRARPGDVNAVAYGRQRIGEYRPYPIAISGISRGDAEADAVAAGVRSEEHTSELQSRFDLVCRLLLEKKKNKHKY